MFIRFFHALFSLPEKVNFSIRNHFRREDLAFGAEVNRLQCSFPSYDNGRWWRERTEDPDAAIPGLAAMLPEGAKLYSQDLWLVGRNPDGDWLVLVNGEPKVLPLAAMLDNYLSFQEEIITRRTRFDLDKSLREMHILEGYKIAIDHIDEVIAIIRASASIPDAKTALMDRFALTDAQAQAIVEMTLGKLSGLERQKIEDRLVKLAEIVADLRDIDPTPYL